MREASRIYLELLLADGGANLKRALRGSKRDWRTKRFLQLTGFPNSAYSIMRVVLNLIGQESMAKSCVRMGSLSADGYWKLVDESSTFCSRFISAMDADNIDALLCPPDGLAALSHDAAFLLGDCLSYCFLSVLSGMPAGVVAVTRVRAGEESDRHSGLDIIARAAIKAETGSAGLPIGVQIIARHWREDIVLAIMAVLEEHFREQPDYPALPPL